MALHWGVREMSAVFPGPRVAVRTQCTVCTRIISGSTSTDARAAQPLGSCQH